MRGIKALRGKIGNADIDKTDRKGRMRRWLRKAKPVILAGSIVLAVLLVLGGTLAWFTSADFVRNPLRRAEPALEFTVVEVDEFDPEPEDGLYTKRVGAQNVGDIPAFVRLLVLPVFKLEDGGPQPTLLPAVLGTEPGPVPADANVIIEDFNLATWNGTAWTGGNWVDGGDGYYYYLNRLDPETSTDIDGLNENLFEHLRLVAMPAGYENATLVIEVKCEALEVKNYREGWWGIIGNTPAPTDPPFSETIVNIDGRLQTQMGS